ncbi:MAG: LytTR family DNA-binding domain-containing protein [Bacteroidia bacterium]|nr:LytTR family DNA-binding domain-containing protein [Bacteroidia bacterium]
MIRAIIVDDEPKSRDVLKTLLERFCTEVEIAGMAGSVAEAEAIIQQVNPDLIFLDIEMPGGNGLKLLESGKTGAADVVFVTSYAHYAIPALRLSAVDYLLKPVEVEELRNAVARVAEKRNSAAGGNIDVLRDNLSNAPAMQKLAIPGIQDVRFIRTSDILRIEADSNYSFIITTSGERIHSSKTLGDFEELLSGVPNFCRVHKTHLVNIDCVVKLIKSDGGYLQMKDGSQVEISRRRKAEVLQILGLS